MFCPWQELVAARLHFGHGESSMSHMEEQHRAGRFGLGERVVHAFSGIERMAEERFGCQDTR
eukprot:1563087-Lingulodinium_polyedra.AAC.1